MMRWVVSIGNAKNVEDGQTQLNSRRRTMDKGYYCVVCGKYIEAVDGVIVHDDIPHPDMAFDDEEKPQ